MAVKEYSPRVLHLTEHIIDLNPAHYTVWLYRANTIFALNANIYDELEWVDSISMDNQKNYQIRHHRQLLIDHLFTTLKSRAEVLALARRELEFMAVMFAQDSKNYHMWSYRQYLVRKLSLFPSQCGTAETGEPDELANMEALIADDVRNNSAWAHRFFLIFFDPGCSSPGSRATERDDAVPAAVIDREIEFAKERLALAPQNQCPWNYIRGVLRKGGRPLAALEGFVAQFVRLGDAECRGDDVKSSHALDFLADAWAEMGEWEKADRALVLLEEKYDRIRGSYWAWRREMVNEMEKSCNVSAAV
jgi:protein farnesyltransferase/geranylgeranyltransferase type-1 subunit alpha